LIIGSLSLIQIYDIAIKFIRFNTHEQAKGSGASFHHEERFGGHRKPRK
jgi:hypothetical protein